MTENTTNRKLLALAQSLLRVLQLVDGDWQRLNTSVVRRTDDGPVLEANASNSPYFVVSAIDDPIVSIAVSSTEVEVDEPVAVAARPSAPTGGTHSEYEWTVEGRQSTGATTVVRFEEPGERTVELVATSEAGETAAANATVHVRPRENTTTDRAVDSTLTPAGSPDAEPGQPPTDSAGGSAGLDDAIGFVLERVLR